MNTLTRRAFGKRLLAAGALPLFDARTLEAQTGTPEPSAAVPDTIAGYTLTADDKQLAAKFLSTHEKNMSALRANDLPNSLAPSFHFASPKIKGGDGDPKR